MSNGLFQRSILATGHEDFILPPSNWQNKFCPDTQKPINAKEKGNSI